MVYAVIIVGTSFIRSVIVEPCIISRKNLFSKKTGVTEQIDSVTVQRDLFGLLCCQCYRKFG
uniref:Uncharacterized protein MANES_15G092100 n=1 Tax=Rhizophora mucronata TaxID=61149 RepID=A0A2P2KSS0_RHIMU